MYAAQKAPAVAAEQQPDPAQVGERHGQCLGDQQDPCPRRPPQRRGPAADATAPWSARADRGTRPSPPHRVAGRPASRRSSSSSTRAPCRTPRPSATPSASGLAPAAGPAAAGSAPRSRCAAAPPHRPRSPAPAWPPAPRRTAPTRPRRSTSSGAGTRDTLATLGHGPPTRRPGRSGWPVRRRPRAILVGPYDADRALLVGRTTPTGQPIGLARDVPRPTETALSRASSQPILPGRRNCQRARRTLPSSQTGPSDS